MISRKNNVCPKCNFKVYSDYTNEGWVIKCTQCNYSSIPQVTELQAEVAWKKDFVPKKQHVATDLSVWTPVSMRIPDPSDKLVDVRYSDGQYITMTASALALDTEAVYWRWHR